nr:MAG TPA: hypothetical protein [Caudoviricetes sp.]
MFVPRTGTGWAICPTGFSVTCGKDIHHHEKPLALELSS